MYRIKQLENLSTFSQKVDRLLDIPVIMDINGCTLCHWHSLKIISIFAGNGTSGFSGLATNAMKFSLSK